MPFNAGYIFAAAEVGVKHNLEHKLQVRDVEGRPRGIKWLKSGIPDPTTSPYMIHMGRAFFPQRGYPAGKPWWMTGATDFHSWTGYGAQGQCLVCSDQRTLRCLDCAVSALCSVVQV